MKVCIIGRGKVGRTLARLWRAADVDVQLQAGRAFSAPLASERIFVLTVPDGALRACAERLAPSLDRRSIVLHCAGARGPEELSACSAQGAAVAGFHPLVSFASPRALTSLHGATFVAHGDARATRAARGLARALGARCIVAPVLGPAYHAAAALLANGSVGLAFAAVTILRELGVAQRDGERALAGLLQTVASNLAQLGVPHALTGPVMRRDKATVRRHAAALRQLSPELARSYRQAQPLIEACAQAAWGERPARPRAASATGTQPRQAPEWRPRPGTKATRARA